MNSPPWRLMRMGDDGNPVLVQAYASQPEAEQQLAILEARRHKQTYWVQPPPPSDANSTLSNERAAP